MASTTTAMHLFANAEYRMVEHDPNVDTDLFVDLCQPAAGQATAFIALGNFRRFAAIYMTSVGTGGLTEFTIQAATSVAGAGAVDVCTSAVTANPNAVGDYLVLECNIEQVREVLATATHIGVLVNLVTATDEGVCTFIRAEPVFPVAGMTADYVS